LNSILLGAGRLVTDMEIVTTLKKIESILESGVPTYRTPYKIAEETFSLSITPVYTEAYDVSNLSQKIIYFENHHDVPALVTVETAPTPSGPFIPIVTDKEIVAGQNAYGLIRDYHVYIRISARTSSAPSTGYFKITLYGLG